MAFSIHQRVRFGASKQFGVIVSIGPLDKDGVQTYRIKAISGSQVSGNISEGAIEADTGFKQGDACYVFGEKKRLLLIAAVIPYPAAGPNESCFDYDLTEMGDTKTRRVNGRLLIEPTSLAQPDELTFHTVVNTAIPLALVPQKLMTTGKIIAFRGDNRDPDEVFRDGFKPRQELVSVLYRGKTADLLSTSGVCASRSAEAAALFPLHIGSSDRLSPHTNLYAFIAREYYDIFSFQSRQRDLEPDMATRIAGLLKGEEIAIGRCGIPGTDVILCCPVTRAWTGKTWQEGCTYTPGEVSFNGACLMAPDEDFPKTKIEISTKVKKISKSPTFPELAD